MHVGPIPSTILIYGYHWNTVCTVIAQVRFWRGAFFAGAFFVGAFFEGCVFYRCVFIYRCIFVGAFLHRCVLATTPSILVLALATYVYGCLNFKLSWTNGLLVVYECSNVFI